MRALSPEPTALLRVIAALEQESDALVHGQVQSLAEVSIRKARWVEEIAHTVRSLSSRERESWRALITRARDLNDRNARLLAARLTTNRARLDALTGAIHPQIASATYGADGRTQTVWRNTVGGSGVLA